MAVLACSDEADALDLAGAVEQLRRYSHFEIALRPDGSLDELGHGAMGTTYRAVDTVLQSPVALKVIGQNVADSPSVRARFLREARSAAKLRHPNVASVFHYGEQQGECFYVMELVEGETLEECVRRDGPLSTKTVLEIGHQVARALSAAEAQGLVHRDIKPGNLMWVASPRLDKSDSPPLIKVIDFGLAKALTTDPDAAGESDTRHGFAGTPAYASPEQFARSADRPVDTRSDLYSLGVTLWHLLCGRTPFRGATLEEIHRQQTRQPLPTDQLTARRVPTPVIALLRSLLAVDPRQRPQSVREFTEGLERCQMQITRLGRSYILRHWVVLTALFALAALVTIAVLRKNLQPGSAIGPPTSTLLRSVAVLPFENLSPDAAETFYTTGIQEQLIADLAHIRALKVIGSDSTRVYPPGNRDPVRIGRELGVSHLIEGSVLRDHEQVQVAIELIDPSGKVPVWAKRYKRPVAEIFALQSEITHEVAARLEAPVAPDEKIAIDEPPTTDPTAYDLYLRAIEANSRLFKTGVELRRALSEGITLLDQAVARDPNFVLAYCKLADFHDEFESANADASPEERAVDHRMLSDVALEKARRLQPDNGNVHLALAHHFLYASHDDGQARIEVDLARRTLPNDAGLEQIAGLIARSQGRWDDAVRSLERAASLDPREPVPYNDLTRLYRALRRYGDAHRASDHLIHLDIAGVFQPLWRAMEPLEERADLGPLRETLDSVKPADDADADLRNRFRIIYSYFARDPDGITRAVAAAKQRRVLMFGFAYPTIWFEALAARMRGDSDARAAFERARASVEPLVAANPGQGRMLGLLALIDAGLGRKDDAVREGLRACELTPVSKSAVNAPVVACQLAAVYAWTDQPDLALALLEQWADKPAGVDLMYQPTYGDLRLNPMWDPLRGNARFAALLQKLAPKTPR